MNLTDDLLDSEREHFEWLVYLLDTDAPTSFFRTAARIFVAEVTDRCHLHGLSPTKAFASLIEEVVEDSDEV